MTAQERVIASRLIQKIDTQEKYAEKIGLSYKLGMVEAHINTIEFKADREK